MNEALVIVNESGKVCGNVLSAVSAGVYNILHSHTERVRIRKAMQREALVIALTVLCTVVTMRKLDVTGVNQSGRVQEESELAPTETVETAEVKQVNAAELVREAQAEKIAKVLYGMRKNSERDLRAVCWVIFNRIESPLYPNTLDEVVSQSGQWVCYYPENPVTSSLKAIAMEELENWENGENRPIEEGVLWFNWSTEGIYFKSEF